MSRAEDADTPSATTLKAAVKWAGSQQKLADKAGVSQQCIWSAIRNGRASGDLAVAIEIGTGGAFLREQFRPDLFLPRGVA